MKPRSIACGRTAWGALWVALGLGLASAAEADTVRIWNRGEVTRLEGSDADDLSRAATELFRASSDPGTGYPTEVWSALRKHEVIVEVQFDEPVTLNLQGREKPVVAEYLFFTLTGDSGPRGRDAPIHVGKRGKKLDILAIPSGNGPDEFGIQYVILMGESPPLDPLRTAVAQYGIVAERPTPRPTPDPAEEGVFTPFPVPEKEAEEK